MQFTDHMGRRLDERLMQVWKDARSGNQGIPLIQNVYQQYIADMWSFLFLLHLDPDGGPAVLEKAGDALTIGVDHDLEGMRTSEVPQHSLIHYATRDYMVAPLKKGPATSSGEFIGQDGNIVLYRSILLPVTQDQTTVSSVLGAASYRIQAVS